MNHPLIRVRTYVRMNESTLYTSEQEEKMLYYRRESRSSRTFTFISFPFISPSTFIDFDEIPFISLNFYSKRSRISLFPFSLSIFLLYTVREFY